MPVTVHPTTRFDPAIDRLERLSGGSNAWYLANHRDRCCDDVERLARLRPGGRILNVGGRPYLFEFAAREAGLAVDTIDLDPGRNPREVADLGVKVLQVDIEDPQSRAALDLARYDVICMAEIFEHLPIDLPSTLGFVRDRMRKDALLYLTTPNFYYAPSFLKALVQGRSGPSLVAEWSKLENTGHMGHVREYAAGELFEFFGHLGFAVDSFLVRNSRPVDLRGGGVAQWPVRLLARFLAARFDRFGQELVFVLRASPEAEPDPTP
ncbi:class I SAM-dependent methyltransferase [Tsuneonella sp. YG55]|uniref:Class I SAM-dependent methyltransferase n=1 Tax=Tsuneonella litorea TaxID=2976475 RepID=A0A9X3AK11_9SPHN|nr:class I SAM-dependent methyltransferase [Tsuneonella litorea]MCT2557749.1 class I SAM-dependent methyltransferase [Tsuneonella litorea]